MALSTDTSPSAQTDTDSNSSSETNDCDLEWCCHMSTTEMILSLDEAEHWHESRLLHPTPFTPPGTRTPLSPSIHFSRFNLRDAVPLQQQLPTERCLFNHPPPPPPPEFEFCKVYCDILMRSAMILNGIANHYGNDNVNRDDTEADGVVDPVVDAVLEYDGRSKHRRGPSIHRIRRRQHQPWSTTTRADDDKEQQHQHQKTSIIRRISRKGRHHLRHKRYQSSSSSSGEEEEELSKTKGVRAMMAESDSPTISTSSTTAQSSVMPLKDINQSNRELPSSDECFLNLNQGLSANCWVVSSSTNNKTHLAMMEASEYNEKFIPLSDRGNANHLDLDHHEEESNLATASSSRVRRFWVKLKKKGCQLRHHGDARIASSSDC